MAQSIKNVPTQNSLSYTLDSQYTAGGTTLVLSSSVAGIAQAPGVVVVDRIDSNSALTPTKRTYYYFTGVSSATLTGVSVADGTDQTHAVGAVVEFIPDVKWAQSVYDALSQVVAPSTGLLDTTKVTDLTTAQVLTNKDLTSGTNSFPTSVVTTTGTQTLTNKRNEPRVVSATSYTTDTGSSLSVATCDLFVVTAQAGALKLNNPGGTPVQGQKLMVRIKDDGTARALTYDTQFRAMGTALPSTTVLSKTLYLGFIYNSTDTKWDLVAAAQEA